MGAESIDFLAGLVHIVHTCLAYVFAYHATSRRHAKQTKKFM